MFSVLSLCPRPREALSSGLGTVGLPQNPARGRPGEQALQTGSLGPAGLTSTVSSAATSFQVAGSISLLGAQVVWERRAGFPARTWEAASSVAPAARPGRPHGGRWLPLQGPWPL